MGCGCGSGVLDLKVSEGVELSRIWVELGWPPACDVVGTGLGGLGAEDAFFGGVTSATGF